MKKIVITLLICILLAITGCSKKPMIFNFLEYPPYCWVDSNEQAKGIYIDIIEEVIHDQMGIPVIYHEYSWDIAQQLVKENKADAFITVPTPERREYTEISNEPLISGIPVIFTQKNNEKLNEIKKIKSISDLQKFQLLDYTGSGWAKENLADCKIEWLPGIEEVLIELAAGKGDIFIQPSLLTNYNIRALHLEDKIIEISTPLDQIHFNLCIGKNSSYAGILPEFDKIIKEMKKDGTLQKIVDKYQ